jgi:hypothetical protein
MMHVFLLLFLLRTVLKAFQNDFICTFFRTCRDAPIYLSDLRLIFYMFPQGDLCAADLSLAPRRNTKLITLLTAIACMTIATGNAGQWLYLAPTFDYYGYWDSNGVLHAWQADQARYDQRTNDFQVQIRGRWLSVGSQIFQLTNFFQQQTKMLGDEWNHLRANNLVTMQDDNITEPPPGQEPEPEVLRWPLVVPFHTSLYRIDNPPPHWSQEKRGEVAECSKCGDTLTFCFVARIDPQKAYFAGSYWDPVAVRCNCFLAEPEPGSKPGYTFNQKLIREPIPIHFGRKIQS